jgi:hypothetical protein
MQRTYYDTTAMILNLELFGKHEKEYEVVMYRAQWAAIQGEDVG